MSARKEKREEKISSSKLKRKNIYIKKIVSERCRERKDKVVRSSNDDGNGQ